MLAFLLLTDILSAATHLMSQLTSQRQSYLWTCNMPGSISSKQQYQNNNIVGREKNNTAREMKERTCMHKNVKISLLLYGGLSGPTYLWLLHWLPYLVENKHSRCVHSGPTASGGFQEIADRDFSNSFASSAGEKMPIHKFHLLSVPILNVYCAFKISISNQQAQTFGVTISCCRERMNTAFAFP